jgi:hypothetical protein
MRHITIRFIRCLILCLAGYANYIFGNPTSAFGSNASPKPCPGWGAVPGASVKLAFLQASSVLFISSSMTS